jgi:hypothetical protein
VKLSLRPPAEISHLIPRSVLLPELLNLTLAATTLVTFDQVFNRFGRTASTSLAGLDWLFATPFYREVALIHGQVAVLLIVATLALFFRGTRGRLVTTGSLCLILMLYLNWWFESWGRFYEIASQPVEQLFQFHGATVWDVWIFELTVVTAAYGLRSLWRRRQGYD